MSERVKKSIAVHDEAPSAADSEAVHNAVLAEDSTNLEAARAATQLEHDRPILETMRLYRNAIMYSAFISLAIIMEGYDMYLMSNFYSVPQFRKQYGFELDNGDYQLSVAWQSALSAISQASAILGLCLVGLLVEWLGFRASMGIALVGVAAAIFLTFFSTNILMLFFGQFLIGIPWGMFQGIASTYAADVSPTAVRPLLTTYINLCWAIGQFVCVGVLRGCLSLDSEWAYRIPFATQWAWIPPIAVALVFTPESPWWLVRKDKYDAARKALRRLATNEVSDEELDNTLRMINLTNQHEMRLQEGDGTRYQDLVKGTNLRRTEISMGAWVCQVTCGTFFASQLTYFMQQAGLNEDDSFNLGLAMTALNLVGTICSWFLTSYVGRRTLYIYGLAGMVVTECIVGFIAIPRSSSAIAWATGGILILNNLIYFLTIGPVCYTVISEIPSARLRSKSIAVARSAYLVTSVGGNFLQPAMINPTGWDLKGKAGFVWGGLAFISLIWTFFRLPETKDRTISEIDKLFEEKVPTRQFSKVEVEVFRDHEDK